MGRVGKVGISVYELVEFVKYQIIGHGKYTYARSK